MPAYNNPYGSYPYAPVQQSQAYPQMTQPMPNNFGNNSVNPYNGGSYGTQMPMQSAQPSRLYCDWVQGDAGAAGYPVARGDTALLLDANPNSNSFYFKSSDPYTGRPLPLEKYRYEKVENFQNGSQMSGTASTTDMEYVSKSEIESMKHELAELKKMLDDLMK